MQIKKYEANYWTKNFLNTHVGVFFHGNINETNANAYIERLYLYGVQNVRQSFRRFSQM